MLSGFKFADLKPTSKVISAITVVTRYFRKWRGFPLYLFDVCPPSILATAMNEQNSRLVIIEYLASRFV